MNTIANVSARTIASQQSRRMRLALALLAFMFVGALASAVLPVQQAHAAAAVSTDVPASSVFESSDGLVAVYGKTAGTVSYDAASKTLTLNAVKAEELAAKSGSVTLNLVGASSLDVPAYYSYRNAQGSYVSGTAAGSLSVKGSGSLAGNVRLKGSLAIQGGTINATSTSSSLPGVTCTKFTMKGGTLNGSLSCTSFSMTGGSISKSGGDCYGIEVEDGGFAMKGGKITLSKAKGGIYLWTSKNKQRTMKVTGGTIKIATPKSAGIYLSAANLAMKGGVVKVTKAQRNGIFAISKAYGSKDLGGKVVASGGKLYVQTYTPRSYVAISADSMSNKPAVLKSIKGALPAGASFKVAGNTYKVKRAYATSGSAILTKYGSSTTSFTFNKAKFGGVSYTVEGVAAKAFNTKAGQKVKKLVFANSIDYIGANAFANTKALTSLVFRQFSAKASYSSDYRTVKSYSLYSGTTINKKAFAKAGKGGGKKLVVTLNKGVYSYQSNAYKKLLVSKGLPKSAKLKLR